MIETWAIPGVVFLAGCFFLVVGALFIHSCGRSWQSGSIRVSYRRRSERTFFRDQNPFDFWFNLVRLALMGAICLFGAVCMFLVLGFLLNLIG